MIYASDTCVRLTRPTLHDAVNRIAEIHHCKLRAFALYKSGNGSEIGSSDVRSILVFLSEVRTMFRCFVRTLTLHRLHTGGYRSGRFDSLGEGT